MYALSVRDHYYYYANMCILTCIHIQCTSYVCRGCVELNCRCATNEISQDDTIGGVGRVGVCHSTFYHCAYSTMLFMTSSVMTFIEKFMSNISAGINQCHYRQYTADFWLGWESRSANIKANLQTILMHKSMSYHINSYLMNPPPPLLLQRINCSHIKYIHV